jgi:hypothetical protein
VNGTSTCRVKVESGGTGAVAHVVCIPANSATCSGSKGSRDNYASTTCSGRLPQAEVPGSGLALRRSLAVAA